VTPLTVQRLLAAAVASDPGRPRLTWYGADGERVELSGRVLANWVAKTANLLLEELLGPPAAGRGRPTVVLDLPVHWRTAVWGLAAWAVGADVAGPDVAGPDGAGDAGPGTVVVTATPATAPTPDPAGAPLVVLSLAALAFATETVPPGALDYNAVVAGYGDDLPGHAEPLELDLPAGAATARVLLEAVATPVEEALRAVASALAADGSVVLRGPGAPDAEHLRGVENVTLG